MLVLLQHHDAITGTMCDSNEGCTGAGGMGEVMGAHNVLAVYEDMLTATAQNSLAVAAARPALPRSWAFFFKLPPRLE